MRFHLVLIAYTLTLGLICTTAACRNTPITIHTSPTPTTIPTLTPTVTPPFTPTPTPTPTLTSVPVPLHEVITEFTIPPSFSNPWGITRGPDGNLWFIENLTNKIGRITTGGIVTEFSLNANTQERDTIMANITWSSLIHSLLASPITACVLLVSFFTLMFDLNFVRRREVRQYVFRRQLRIERLAAFLVFILIALNIYLTITGA